METPGRLPVQPPPMPRNAPPAQLSLVLSLKNSNGLSAVTPAHQPGQPTSMIDIADNGTYRHPSDLTQSARDLSAGPNSEGRL